MAGNKLSIRDAQGTIDGVYCDAGPDSPLVIIINGHNGFYNYGMFPYIQRHLREHGISSYSFNFSHGGVNGDSDYFEDLEKYEQNCMRLETEDLMRVLHSLAGSFSHHPAIFLLAHSLGGVPTIFGTKKAIAEKINISGVILVSAVKTLDFWPRAMIREWALAGVFYKKNNRTKQDLPQGFEFLQEIVKCDTHWNVQQAIGTLTVPILIIHGDDDEAVPPEHAKALFSWIHNPGAHTRLQIISGATHTYNTKHPFEKTSDALDTLLATVVDWIRELLKPVNTP